MMSYSPATRDCMRHDLIKCRVAHGFEEDSSPQGLGEMIARNADVRPYTFRTRWYSPSLETWTQQDPAGYIDAPDLYEFERSNPARYVDPAGLAPEGGIVLPGGGWLGQDGEYRPDLAPLRMAR